MPGQRGAILRRINEGMSSMKIKITLDNGGGELDSSIIDVEGEDGSPTHANAASEAIKGVMENWTLSPGDTITIREL